MDYVVFGIGFGATILVLGLLVRDIGPRIRYRTPAGEDGVFHAEELVARVSWGRFCSALGAVLAIGGLIFLVTTVVCMVLRLSDDTGGWVMLGGLAFLLVLMAYWTWAFFDRFGSFGILPEREEAPAQEPVRPASTPRGADRAPTPTRVGPVGEDASESIDSGTEHVAEASVAADAPIDEGDEPQEIPAPGDDEPRDAGSETSVDDSDDTDDAPLKTPEERLAHMESPIDHGSAEGDLDIAAGGPRRPAPRPRRMVSRAQQEPASAADPARADEPGGAATGDDDSSAEPDREQR